MNKLTYIHCMLRALCNREKQMAQCITRNYILKLHRFDGAEQKSFSEQERFMQMEITFILRKN